MKKINIILIILFIIGCAGNKEKKWSNKDSRKKSEITVYSQHWNTAEDTLNLFLHVRLPLNQFVFRKLSDHFYSDVTYILSIYHAEKNTQIYRESWNERVIQLYYEDTRNPDNYFTTERNISLTPGTYNMLLNVQDEDSRRIWKINKEYKLDKVDVLGPSLLFVSNEKSQKDFAVNIMEEIDTIWIRTQVLLPEHSPQAVNFTLLHKETVVDSGVVNVTPMGVKHLYYLPIPMTLQKRGWYEIILSCQGEKKTLSFNYGIKGKLYWTDNVNEVVEVMQYIFLSHSEYKNLKNMDESLQWEYIHEYWQKKDPSPNTEENELLNQLNDRVKYVNKNFSILMPGWRSDRGRIYIIYGQPQYIDESYQDQIGYTYQKWMYPSGKQFIFIDRSMSGDYSLFREMY